MDTKINLHVTVKKKEKEKKRPLRWVLTCSLNCWCVKNTSLLKIWIRFYDCHNQINSFISILERVMQVAIF